MYLAVSHSSSYLESGDVEILPERQTQHVQVLTAVTKRTGQCDEDWREEEEEAIMKNRCCG